MKLKIIKIILVFVFIPSLIYSQATINIGVKLDAFALHTEKLKTVTNYENKYTFFAPRAGYLFIHGTLNKKAKIGAALRLGYLDADDYSGFELGMFLNKYFLKNMYFQLGFNIHFNQEKIFCNDIHDKSDSKPINFLSAGIGLDFTKHIFAELIFDYALNNEYGISVPFDQKYSAKAKNVFDIFRIGLGYKI